MNGVSCSQSKEKFVERKRPKRGELCFVGVEFNGIHIEAGHRRPEGAVVVERLLPTVNLHEKRPASLSAVGLHTDAINQHFTSTL